MVQRFAAAVLWGALLGCLMISLAVSPSIASAQQTQGTISVTVVDPSGGVIPDAQLKLVDVSTNDTRTSKTLENGTYSFINLKIGSYKLTVTKPGFSTQVYNAEVLAGRVTDLKASLKLGKTEEVVEVVGSATPLIETSSSAINMTMVTEQIENLPLSGRDISALSRLSAGYNGTWNGLATMAQGSSIDGIVSNSGRWKYSAGADSNSIVPRLENIAEMTVSTNQLDLNNGFGTSNMQISYTTRRGGNAFHGRLYEDFRNSALNAKSWTLGANGKKPRLILNEFGGSVGGPILKDKLFFFGSFSMSKQPGGYSVVNSYFTPEAQSGIFKWVDDNGASHTVNLYNAVGAYNAANPGLSALPVVRNTQIGNRMAEINGFLSGGTAYTLNTNDPNVRGLTWNMSSPITKYYPTVRLDYLLSQSHRLSFAYNQSKTSQPNAYAGWWPGDGKEAGSRSNNFNSVLSLESTLTPTLINNLRFGYLYTASWYSPDAPKDFYNSDAREVGWGYSVPGDYYMSGQTYQLPNSRMQPVFSIANDMTWMKGKHTMMFGFSAYRDQNKYWDPPEGYPKIWLGLSENDPAQLALTKTSLAADGTPLSDDALSQARQLYAILTGRVSSFDTRHAFNPQTQGFATDTRGNTLNELMKSWGLYMQDSYRILPNLTLNYGMRWDFVGANQDLTKKYQNMTAADMFGPSGVWNLFNPGSLKGTNDPLLTQRSRAYDPWKVTPQPAFGLAWTPRSSGSLIERLLGGDKTVIRAGYSLRRYTEPQQFVWDYSSNYAAGFYQSAWASPVTNPSGDGEYVPGSLSLGQALPPYAYSPSEYQRVVHMSDYTFSGQAYVALNPKIRQPYTQSWNVGFQRELGKTRALEVRYVGNRTIHQWIAQDINEVNIFENGFLNEFKAAQKNLQLNGGSSFAYDANKAGSAQLPIMTAAGVDFTKADFITNLQNGAAGSFASTLASRDYFCKMMGSSFAPCGSSAAPSGYPVNLFMANPYAIGAWTGAKYATDAGFSTYNSLQVEFRQRTWHGLNYTANYTWSKTLGAATAGDWTGSYTQVTLRDPRSSYAPANTDRQHVAHVYASYDLPFGKGKQWLNQGGLVDRILGGWTISTVYQFQTGTPFRISGQYYTYNNLTDGGVVLNGVTASDIQKQVGVYYQPSSNAAGSSTIYYINPAYAAGLKSGNYVKSYTTPGGMGQRLYLHGPHQSFDDIALSKSVNLNEQIKFKLQAEMINAFNHPIFGVSNASIGSSSFGRGYYAGTPRRVEFRANVEF